MTVEAQQLGKPATLHRREGDRVVCTACARYCKLREGQIGLCGVRGVFGGELRLLVYGRVITGQVDPIEKKPVTHYMPGTKIFSIATTGCNWLCHPAGTKVLLADGGEKNVEDLLPGDAVWSYDVGNGLSIGPSIVTHVGARVARLWEVRYGPRGDWRLLLTEEHPVLTRTGWKPVNMLKPGDAVLNVWYRETGNSGKNLSSSFNNAKFNCTRCGVEVVGLDDWNRHRELCYNARVDISLHHPPHGRGGNPSAARTRLYEILDSLGVDYELDYGVFGGKISASAQYFFDAAFPDMKIGVEVGGLRHLNYSAERVREEMRSEGWEILRLQAPYLFNHPEEVKALIAHRLSAPVMVNRRRWVEVTDVYPLDRAELVYSFECIPNHNYVADGVVVHNCAYCQNFDISQRRKVEGVEASPQQVVEMALRYGSDGIAYTYNEPSIFMEYAHDIGVLARKKGLINIFVTNGYWTPDAVTMASEFLDCATVDFKGSGEREFVRKYIGIPDAEPVFQTLLEMRQRTKIHIEITDLIVPEIGDSLEAARRLCRWVYENLGPETPIHFLRFHPDYKLLHLPWTPVETLEKHCQIAREEGLLYVYVGNVPGHPLENTYCPGCGKVVVERRGFDILDWRLDENNRCPECGYAINIVGRPPARKVSGRKRFIPVSF